MHLFFTKPFLVGCVLKAEVSVQVISDISSYLSPSYHCRLDKKKRKKKHMLQEKKIIRFTFISTYLCSPKGPRKPSSPHPSFLSSMVKYVNTMSKVILQRGTKEERGLTEGAREIEKERERERSL